MGAEVPQLIYYLMRDPSDHLSSKVSPTYNPTNVRTSVFLPLGQTATWIDRQMSPWSTYWLMIPLSVLVVPCIATPLQNTVSISVTHLPHLQNLQLAHPLAPEREFKISLLVGADHYWDTVGDHIVRGAWTAVASKLGFLFSGPVQLTNILHTNTSTMMLTVTYDSEFNLECFWNLRVCSVWEWHQC